MVEEPGAGEREGACLRDHLHRGAPLQLPGEPAQPGQPSVPAATVLGDAGDEARALAERQRTAAHREERQAPEEGPSREGKRHRWSQGAGLSTPILQQRRRRASSCPGGRV